MIRFTEFSETLKNDFQSEVGIKKSFEKHSECFKEKLQLLLKRNVFQKMFHSVLRFKHEFYIFGA